MSHGGLYSNVREWAVGSNGKLKILLEEAVMLAYVRVHRKSNISLKY
jgi:hypothetical protein